jgi:hypothetical protein
MIDFIKDNWFSLLSIVITPIAIAIINKKTITFSSADDVIKLKEYNENKKAMRRRNKFYLNLYKKCFQKQQKYKGWTLWDFQEFGDIENRGFCVKNEEGEYLAIGFPKNIIVRRYGYDPNDRLSHGNYCYKPNIIENLIAEFKEFHNKKLIEKTLPDMIAFLEKRKANNEKVELSDIIKHYKNINFCLIEKMLENLRGDKQKKDLTDLITIRKVNTNQNVPYFNDKRDIKH